MFFDFILYIVFCKDDDVPCEIKLIESSMLSELFANSVLIDLIGTDKKCTNIILSNSVYDVNSNEPRLSLNDILIVFHLNSLDPSSKNKKLLENNCFNCDSYKNEKNIEMMLFVKPSLSLCQNFTIENDEYKTKCSLLFHFSNLYSILMSKNFTLTYCEIMKISSTMNRGKIDAKNDNLIFQHVFAKEMKKRNHLLVEKNFFKRVNDILKVPMILDFKGLLQQIFDKKCQPVKKFLNNVENFFYASILIEIGDFHFGNSVYRLHEIFISRTKDGFFFEFNKNSVLNQKNISENIEILSAGTFDKNDLEYENIFLSKIVQNSNFGEKDKISSLKCLSFNDEGLKLNFSNYIVYSKSQEFDISINDELKNAFYDNLVCQDEKNISKKEKCNFFRTKSTLMNKKSTSVREKFNLKRNSLKQMDFEKTILVALLAILPISLLIFFVLYKFFFVKNENDQNFFTFK